METRVGEVTENAFSRQLSVVEETSLARTSGEGQNDYASLWKQNGGPKKRVVTNNEGEKRTVTRRQYYCRGIPAQKISCPNKVRRTVDFDEDELVISTTYSQEEHGHEKPAPKKTGRLSNKMKEVCLEKLSVAAPAVVRRQLDQERRKAGLPLCSFPTLKQLQNLKEKESRKDFTSANDFDNIREMTNFWRETRLLPEKSFILLTEAGARRLERHGATSYFDMTFNISNRNLH